MGFEVFEASNLDHVQMPRALGDFLRRAADARTVVLFYAGHGMQIDGKNCLLPIDAKFGRADEQESSTFTQTFELDAILDALVKFLIA